MSAPWTPSPNPGGQNRRLVRESVKAWLDAQEIPGIGHIYPGMDSGGLHFEDYPSTGGDRDCECLVMIDIANDIESREAYTGPDNPGGKMIFYQIELEIFHNGNNADAWAEAHNDYDRIVDALKACLRAEGRNLGRPDVYLTAGEYPRSSSIVVQSDPVANSNGVAVRHGIMSFQVTQYLTGFVPS